MQKKTKFVLFAGKVDVKSLITGTRKDLYIEADRNHTPLPRPQMLSPDSVTSLLISIVTSVSGMGACPLDARLTHLGLNSFDIVRIANQIRTELEVRFGSHDGHMTMLVENLLGCEVCDVAKYIVDELSGLPQGNGGPPGSLQGSHAGHVTGGEVAIGGDDVTASKGRKRYSFLNSITSPAKKSARNLNVKPEHWDLQGSCDGHVTSVGNQVITVESWRRGQYFINGKYELALGAGPE